MNVLHHEDLEELEEGSSTRHMEKMKMDPYVQVFCITVHSHQRKKVWFFVNPLTEKRYLHSRSSDVNTQVIFFFFFFFFFLRFEELSVAS